MVEIFPGAIREVWTWFHERSLPCIIIDRDDQMDWWNILTPFGFNIAYSSRIFNVGEACPERPMEFC